MYWLEAYIIEKPARIYSISMEIAHTFLHSPRQCSALEHHCVIIGNSRNRIDSTTHSGIYHIIATIYHHKHIMLYVMYVQHQEIFLFWFFFLDRRRFHAYNRHYRILCAFVIAFENQKLVYMVISFGTCDRIYYRV